MATIGTGLTIQIIGTLEQVAHLFDNEQALERMALGPQFLVELLNFLAPLKPFELFEFFGTIETLPQKC